MKAIEKNINFEEVVNICKGFINNPTDENLAKYNDLQSRLVVRSYLPMEEKVVAMFRVVINSDKSVDIPVSIFTAGFELSLLFDALLSYTNIENNFLIDLKNYENYDLIYQSGLADYILSFCQKDYERLVRMLERSYSYENLVDLTKTISTISSSNIDQLTEEFKKIKDDFDPDLIKDLASIIRYNDPTINELGGLIEDKAITDVLS